MLVIGGSNGDDFIRIRPTANRDTIKVRIKRRTIQSNSAARLLLRLTASSSMHSQAMIDVQVADGIAISAWLYGGAGNYFLQGGAGDDILLGGLVRICFWAEPAAIS